MNHGRQTEPTEGKGEAIVVGQLGALYAIWLREVKRALRDRGTLSRAEVDDVLADVQDQVAGKASYLVEGVRRDLEREDDE